MDHYQRLGVAPDASYTEMRAAYRKLAQRLHPDAAGGDEDAMARLNEAWRVLSDARRRLAYDRSLTQAAPQRAPDPPTASTRTQRQPPPGPNHDDIDDDDEAGFSGLDAVDSVVLRRWLRLMTVTVLFAIVVVSAMFVYAFTRSVG